MAYLQPRKKCFQVIVQHDRRRYRVPAFSRDTTGERLSEELGRNVEKLLEARAGGTIHPALRRFVEALPTRIRKSMAKQGIIDAAAEGKTLAVHVEEYRTALLTKGNTTDHVNVTTSAILGVMGSTNAKMIGDVKVAKIREYLANKRAETPVLDKAGEPMKDEGGNVIVRRGVSARRHNAILTAVGGFFRWCIREGRAFENPTINVPRLNERTDKRHTRRALTPAEVRALISAADNGEELYGIGARNVLSSIAPQSKPAYA